MANWLNTTFAGFDGGIFKAVSGIAGEGLNKLCSFISFFGEKGWLALLTGLILLLFAKTRKVGFAVLFAVAVGALFTNIILKEAVARPRPYKELEYVVYWLKAGATVESEFSFPSGHTTAITAGAVAIFISCNKKWSFLPLIFAFIMGFTRVYLIVHYPTDVIAGFIVGTVGGIAGYFISKAIMNFASKRKGKGFFKFLVKADICNLFKKKKSK